MIDQSDNIYIVQIKYCDSSGGHAHAIGGVHNCIQGAKREVSQIWENSLREDPSMCRWTPSSQLYECDQGEPIFVTSLFKRREDGMLELVANVEILLRALKSGHPLEVLSEQAE